jgi:dienelactone hydrolase
MFVAVLPAACGTAPRTAPRRTQTRSPRVVVGHLHRHPRAGVRTVTFAFFDRRRGRRLLTVVRFPAAPREPLPLIVFGHGFDQTPAPYARLLRDWAAAGFVVAAPLFPFENAHAPGGPNESDLVNQPADMSFVISALLRRSAAPSGALAGRIDPGRIAVAGHSDGGETALAVAYDPPYRDPRVRAAVLLSGAQIPGGGSFTIPAGSPPLLVVQGTGDTVVPAASAFSFYAAAHPPKFLLELLGASHLAPYTTDLRRLAVVARVSIAFLARYLAGHGSLAAIARATRGSVPVRLLTVP